MSLQWFEDHPEALYDDYVEWNEQYAEAEHPQRLAAHERLGRQAGGVCWPGPQVQSTLVVEEVPCRARA